MENWQTEELEECLSAIIDYRGKTPIKTSSGIPLITAKIVKNGRIETPDEFIAEENYKSWMTRGYPKIGDVILTTEAPLGEVAQINNERVALAQRIILLRGKEDYLDNTYLKYYLISDFGQSELSSRQSGTTVFGIKQSELRKIKIVFPSFEEQKAIAKILSSLDDKIELNRRMNATLEAMARVLFKAWFVDFEPVRANMENRPSESASPEIAKLFPSEFENGIPKGWKTNELGNHLDVVRGLSYKGSGLTEKDFGVPMNNLNSVYEGGGYKYEGIKFYSGDFKEKHITKPRDIIVANTEQGHKHLLIGFPAIVPFYFGETTIFSHHIYRVRPNNTTYLKPQFIYYLLLTPAIREIIVGCSSGTTVNMLKIDGLQIPKFALPSEDIISSFSEIIENIWQKQECLYKENQILTQTRDSLLPRLISGKIRRGEIKNEVEVEIE